MTTLLLALAGIATGLLVCFAILMVVLPIYAAGGLFVNKPGGRQKSGVHFFTGVEPGQVKIIERNKKPVRMVTTVAGKVFQRSGSRNGPDYWKFIDRPGASEDPIADVWWPIRWWARIVYQKTGLVFTGIYPFQRVREYELERTEIVLKEEGRGMEESNLELVVKKDVSDHYRARQFLFPMHITAAETKDKIPLDVIGVAEMEVTNPYLAAYGTDRWDHSMNNLVSDAINEATKLLKLDQALTAKNQREARRIPDAVLGIADDEITCGINITGFRVREINPVLDAERKKIIQAEALAGQQAKATRIDGKARADALRALNEANAAGGNDATATMQAEALVRAAKAAGESGGSVFLMPGNGHGGGADPLQAAILAELKKLNRQRRT